MNERSMIKQYIILGILLLIAVFVLTGIEGGDRPAEISEGQNPGGETIVQAGANDGAGGNDLRSGGSLSSSFSNTTPRNASSSGSQSSLGEPQFTSATSSAFGAATSTPFRSDESSDNPFSVPTEDVEYLQTSGDFKQSIKANNVFRDQRLDSKENAVTSPPGELTNTDEAKADKDSEEQATEKLSDDNLPPELQSNIQISGHVIDDSGGLIKSLPLTLTLLQASAENTARFGTSTRNVRSNEQGFYAFLNLVEGDYRVCTVESSVYKQVCQNPRAPHLSADFLIRATANGRVFGVVKDAQGRPLRDVSISASPNQKNRAVTDEAGEYSLLMTVSKNLSYQIYLDKKEYKRERIAIKGAELLGNKELNVQLNSDQLSGFEVSGVVRDQSGNPINGRAVSLYSPGLKLTHPLRGTSNQNGEFIIPYVQAAKDYRLSVNTRGGYTFDNSAYKQLDIFKGMAPLQLQLQKGGVGNFNARVITQNGQPVDGQVFTLYSDSSFEGRATSDISGQIQFTDVSVKNGGSKLRVINSSQPRYMFSGITLAQGEYKSGIELVVDSGENLLHVFVKDSETQAPIQGAQGTLSWTFSNKGVLSQTTRSQGKISVEGSGKIEYSGLGSGPHQLRVTMQGNVYKPYVEMIQVNQALQHHEVWLEKQ